MDPSWILLASSLDPSSIGAAPSRGGGGVRHFLRTRPPPPPTPGLFVTQGCWTPPVQGSLPRPRALRYPEASVWRGHGGLFVTPSRLGTTQDPPLEPSGSSLDPSWILLGALFSPFLDSLAHLGSLLDPCLIHLDPSWILLGSFLDRSLISLGSTLDPSGSYFGPYWILLGSGFDPSWIHLGSILDPSGSFLEPSWILFRSLFDPS